MKMRLFDPALTGILFVLSLVQVEAFWRLVCGTIQTGRVDPIISPGGVAGHGHTVSGPISISDPRML